MVVENIGSNMTQIATDKYIILVSYQTPVAYHDRVTGYYYRTSKRWSPTTTRHINKWLKGLLAYVKAEVDQSILDALLD